MSTTRSRPPAPPPGLEVGGYRLITKLGEGGMGVVHLAQGPDGERVALKVLRPHVVGDDEARERLAREVASLRRVRSPRVAEIVGADPWGDTPFIVTRYVPGLTLHEHVRQEGAIGGEDLRWFARGLAEAVIAVHTAGVVHRDVKPSNVLMEGRSPVLIDFGLARLAEDPRLTVTGWLLGTPGYLAPEILYGEDATTTSDVHSWAATVAFAATGRCPFGTGPAMAIMDRVRRGEHDLSGVPVDVLPLVAAALAPRPADRPTLPAVLADLSESRRRGHVPVGERTMPLALAGPDRDPTEVFPTGGPATLVPGPASATAPTAARGLARVQRGALLGGLAAGVAVAFAIAPYLCLGALTLLAWMVRTWSWDTQAARERVWRRGRRRWYDGPLAVATLPWYLLVAAGGTLALVAWSACLTLLTGVGLLLFRVPTDSGLLVMGAVLGLSLWWGPGGRRVRVSTRALALRATERRWSGWLSVLTAGALLALAVYVMVEEGVVWDPRPGPPWREGTLLGRLARHL